MRHASWRGGAGVWANRNSYSTHPLSTCYSGNPSHRSVCPCTRDPVARYRLLLLLLPTTRTDRPRVSYMSTCVKRAVHTLGLPTTAGDEASTCYSGNPSHRVDGASAVRELVTQSPATALSRTYVKRA
eukprot:3965696-Prymnesium_polylepis.1